MPSFKTGWTWLGSVFLKPGWDGINFIFPVASLYFNSSLRHFNLWDFFFFHMIWSKIMHRHSAEQSQKPPQGSVGELRGRLRYWVRWIWVEKYIVSQRHLIWIHRRFTVVHIVGIILFWDTFLFFYSHYKGKLLLNFHIDMFGRVWSIRFKKLCIFNKWHTINNIFMDNNVYLCHKGINTKNPQVIKTNKSSTVQSSLFKVFVNPVSFHCISFWPLSGI